MSEFLGGDRPDGGKAVSGKGPESGKDGADGAAYFYTKEDLR